jgi:hypothetical protein
VSLPLIRAQGTCIVRRLLRAPVVCCFDSRAPAPEFLCVRAPESPGNLRISNMLVPILRASSRAVASSSPALRAAPMGAALQAVHSRGLATGKELRFSVDARNQMARGVDALADAVEVTLGPKGRNVVIEKSYGPPQITKVRDLNATGYFELYYPCVDSFAARSDAPFVSGCSLGR